MIEATTHTAGDREVEVLTVENDECRVVLTNVGARLLELHVPDVDGVLADVVLGRATLAESARDPNYMGSTAGRYANRIRNGRFTLDGTAWQLTRNEGHHHLHGGAPGFDQLLWETRFDANRDEVVFTLVSQDGEQGYPGTLTTQVSYRLTGTSLSIDIEATTDRPTIANIVHHSYINLAGAGSGSVLGQLLTLRSSFYTPVDTELLPAGEILAVDGTPFDFRSPTPIGRHLHEVHPLGTRDVRVPSAGYDHNWVLEGAGLRDVAWLEDPKSGRRLTLATDQPGVQVYAGGYLAGVSAKGDLGVYEAFAGLTLETQTFPDSPNQVHFPSPVLRPGETYRNTVRMTFSTVAARTSASDPAGRGPGPDDGSA